VIAGNTHTPITTTNRNSTHTPSAQQRQQQLQNLPDYGRRRHERRRRRLSRGAGVAKFTPTTLHCAYSEGGAAGHTLHNSNSKPRRAAHETKHNMHCKEITTQREPQLGTRTFKPPQANRTALALGCQQQQHACGSTTNTNGQDGGSAGVSIHIHNPASAGLYHYVGVAVTAPTNTQRPALA